MTSSLSGVVDLLPPVGRSPARPLDTDQEEDFSMVARLVAGIVPGDQQEAADLRTALAWLASTTDVYRREKPATPDPHLVAYVVPVDPRTGRILLGEHVLSGRWLPPGGHVEVGEHPADAARREAREELGVDAAVDGPVFLSVGRTVGAGSHTDVSLWFTFPLIEPVALDPREFRVARWWDPDELPPTVDPAYPRFLAKLTGGILAR
jgi:8-oxo-dGTP pyrophosphatase MutT (NUDIX family)